jgi:Cupin/Phage integrase, N-terminal SAM-like domain
VTAGTAWLRVDGCQPVQLMPGDLLLLPSGTAHRLSSEAKSRCRPFDRSMTKELMTPEGDLELGSHGCAAGVHTEPHVGSSRTLMAPRANGQVLKPSGQRRSFSLRFRAYGRRRVIKLGRPEDGWTTQMAERELAVVLRDVDLGTWRPPRQDPSPGNEVDPTFHEFASDCFASKRLEIETNTANHYRNDLTNHLLPFFKGHHLSQITVAEVDCYRQHTRCARRPRSPRRPRPESR